MLNVNPVELTLDEILYFLPKPIDIKGKVGYPSLYWDDQTGEGVWTASYLDELSPDPAQFWVDEDEGVFELVSQGPTPHDALAGLYRESLKRINLLERGARQ